jgi:cephalosporin hydroxylase
MSAVFEHLTSDDRFAIDEDMNRKLLITMGRNGFLRRKKACGTPAPPSGGE